jgi:hypothetical protein
VATKRKRKLDEQLISLETEVGVTLHGYVICNPRNQKEADQLARQGEAVIHQLQMKADEQGWFYLPIALQTRLTTGGKIVRDILRQSKEATDSIQLTLDGVQPFHSSVFSLPTGCDDNKRLMESHYRRSR